MDEAKLLWCKRSARKPVDKPDDPQNRRGRYLHEYWDEEGRIFRCYLDHDGECDWGIPPDTSPGQ